MKKILLTSLAALLIASGANAGVYVAGHVTTRSGGGEDIFDTYALDAAVGYAFNNGWRVELDILTANLWDNDDDTDINFDLAIQPGYLKGLYDFKNDSQFTPYVGAGLRNLGLGYIYDHDEKASYRGYGLGVVGIVGIQYALNKSVSLDLQYNREYSRTWSKESGSPSSSGSSNGSAYKLGIVHRF